MRRRRSVLVNLIFIVFFLIGIVGFVIIDQRLRPTLQQIAEAKARVIATEAINEAIRDKIAGSIKWEDLYALRPDSRGKVVLVQPNTGEIDRLTAEVAVEVQKNLKKITEEKIPIPLGQAFGSQILANLGPRIIISVAPLGTVKTNIISKFEQAGINQIRHKIYLDVTAHIKIVVPLVSSDVQVTSQVPITEVMIMGEVPQVYFGLQGQGGDRAQNFREE